MANRITRMVQNTGLITSDLNCRSHHTALKYLGTRCVNTILSNKTIYIYFFSASDIVVSIAQHTACTKSQPDSCMQTTTGAAKPCCTLQIVTSVLILLHQWCHCWDLPATCFTPRALRSPLRMVCSSGTEPYRTRSFVLWICSPKKFSFT